MTKDKQLTFEQSIKELENIVSRLEEGELTLEESMDFFQKGVMLSNICSKMLDEAEQKVSILVKARDGEVTEKPFLTTQEENDEF